MSYSDKSRTKKKRKTKATAKMMRMTTKTTATRSRNRSVKNDTARSCVQLPIPIQRRPLRAVTRLLQSSPRGTHGQSEGTGVHVSQLREQRASLVNELRHVDAALAVLGKLEGGRSYTKPRRHSRRTMSASARRRISLAQKARWAKRNSTGRAGVPKRHVSAASRRKMAAAQRARWARFNQRKAA